MNSCFLLETQFSKDITHDSIKPIAKHSFWKLTNTYFVNDTSAYIIRYIVYDILNAHVCNMRVSGGKKVKSEYVCLSDLRYLMQLKWSQILGDADEEDIVSLKYTPRIMHTCRVVLCFVLDLKYLWVFTHIHKGFFTDTEAIKKWSLCQWASCQRRKIAGCARAGNAGNVLQWNGNDTSRTCRNACRDR